jgi:hypothetical protein
MKHEIIYTEYYAVIARKLTSPGKEGQVFLTQENIVHSVVGYNYGDRLVIAHRPLADAPILEGVPLLPEFEQGEDDAKLIAKQEAEKLHDKVKHEDWDIYEVLVSEDAWLIERGYNKAKETYKYTEEDLIKAIELAQTPSDYDSFPLIDEVMQSLQQPKRPTHFIAKIQALDENGREIDNAILDGDRTVLKSTTDQSGRKCLIGNYI